MTGFGSAEKDGFSVEIRSLNHRFIDINLKIPSYINKYDIPLRNIVKERFQRGKFDISITITDKKTPQFKIKSELAQNLYTGLQDLQKQLSIIGSISLDTIIATYGDILIEEEPTYDTDALFAAFHEALAHLEEMRIREGTLLTDELHMRLRSLQSMNNEVQSHMPNDVERLREKFTEKLGLMLDAGVIDTNRIMQEAVLMAEKLDISEEVSRIENHIKQVEEILNTDDIIGRKLDFILQELGREVNTLTSKSSAYAISNIAVEMKTEIEKMREQVQNIQ